MLVLLTILNLLTSSNAVTFFLVVPDGSVSGQLGSSVVLPCTLSPSQDCREFEIQWYRKKDRDNPVLLYKDLKVQENYGDPQYRGRVSLVGDLKKGNVSLKLENLTLADRGEYVCFVDRTKWYDQASVFITVPVVGSPPLQSLTEVGDQVNVTCESDGWSPKPTLTWRDRSGKELWNSPKYYTQDSEGLVSVRSWLMFSPSDSEWISCSVGLSDQEMKEGRVLILNSVSKTLQSGWKAAFLVLLVIFVVVIIFLMIKGHVWRKPSKPPQTDDEAPLFGE
ncbi:butyrophilin-like protein 2 [Astyanax mexicanus]|uniref:butyrophilin-like protein 2 n=1 Tax=Astyanax mexicanus TaxID=7994 RepID=UPI0020CB388E|nr:butyrophilin-like protein 2 [Astyanax mexicanus]